MPKAVSRLGDDEQAPRKGEPLNLIVCRSEVVAGEVRLDVSAPATARGPAGGKLLVKHVYRLQEGSTAKEEYRVLLKSVLNGKVHPPSLKRFGDNFAITDDYSGFLVHEYKLPTSGSTVLEFDVAIEYTVGGWDDEQVDVHEVRRQGGVVRIQVG